jgi:hypothetical protein
MHLLDSKTLRERKTRQGDVLIVKSTYSEDDLEDDDYDEILRYEIYLIESNQTANIQAADLLEQNETLQECLDSPNWKD